MMFTVGCSMFRDRYKFLSLILDNMTKTCGYERKTLYQYDYFKLTSKEDVIGNLTREDCRSTKSPQKVDMFKNES